MKILCIKDVTDNNSKERPSTEKYFLKGNIYELKVSGKTLVFINEEGPLHVLGRLDEDGTLKDDEEWFKEHFKVVFE